MTEPVALESYRLPHEEAAAVRLRPGAPRNLALDNLRGIVILIVLAFHSALAYVSWVDAPTVGFDSPPYAWRAFPIVDPHRFFGFDLFCAWQDIYLMSLLFFLSGLFVWPSLQRKTNWQFLRDRVLRLGIPYAFGIAVIIPIAEYPAYSVSAAEPSLAGYWDALLALPFWPNGPLWFLWQLLAVNVIAVLVNVVAPNALPALGRWSAAAESRFGRYFAALLAAAALAYVPLALIFTPWRWSDTWIFPVQFCRPLLYAVFFFAGAGLGAVGIDRGLLAVNGPLARRWALWLGGALASLALWMGLTALTLNGDAPIAITIAAALAYVPACAAGSFFLIAASLRFAGGRSRTLGALGVNAYGLYLLHYVFVVWLQYALLAVPASAVIKAPIVFGLTLALTWIAVTAVQRYSLGARLIGSEQRPAAGFAP